jgi:uncharacterized protein YndB with AHSA1/START domain
MTINKSYACALAQDTIEIKRLFPGPVERVWSYVTEGAKRAKWLAGGDDIPQTPGERFTLIFRHSTLSEVEEETPAEYKASDTPEGIRGECRLEAINPPNSLTFTWDEADGDASEVTFELTQDGDKTLLTVTHRKLRSAEEMLGVSGGWHTHLDIMVDVFEGRPARGFWTTHSALDKEYRKRLKLN